MTQHSSASRRVVIFGAYGDVNAGDEAILTEILIRCATLGLDPTVISFDAEATSRRHLVKSVNLSRHGRLHPEAKAALLASEVLILGGGELLQAGRWGNTLTGLMAWVACLLEAAPKDMLTIAWSVGVQKPERAFQGRQLRTVARCLSFMAVRDEASRAYVTSASRETRTVLTADPVWAFDCERKEDKSQQSRQVLLAPAIENQHDRAFWRHLPSEQVAAEAGCLLLLMDRKRDRSWPLNDPSVHRGGVDVIDALDMRLPALFDTVGGASRVLTGRMHVALIALRQGVPVMVVARNQKMRNFAEAARLPFVGTDDPLCAEVRTFVECEQGVLASGTRDWVTRQRASSAAAVGQIERLLDA